MVHIVRYPSEDFSELRALEVFGSKREALRRAKWIQKTDFSEWEVIQTTGDFRPFQGQDKIVVQSMESLSIYNNVEL